MNEAILIVGGLIVGGAVGWYIGVLRSKSVLSGEVARLTASLEEVRGQVTAKTEELADVRKASEAALAAARAELESQKVASAKTNERLDAAREHFAEQRRQIEEMEKKVKDSFAALSATALKSNNEQFVTLAEAKMKPLREQLERYEKQIKTLEDARIGAYSGLNEKVTALGERSDKLKQETHGLVAALRQPGAKGKWGEVSLQRIVELSGMTEHCDFEKQSTLDGGQRPDLIVRMPGGRTLVVDSKVNTGAYLDAVGATEEERRKRYLAKYASDVRTTMKDLGRREYWRQFSPSPEFVVMFMPGEAFFAAAVSQDHGLLVDGVDKGVLLASPTTLIALLLAVRHGWQQQQMAENARKIADAGQDLYDRLRVFVGHVDKVWDGLQKAAEAHRNAIGSWKSRVLPGVSRLRELGAGTGKEIGELQGAELPMRRLLPEEEDDEAGSRPGT
ncbi:MAG: DNA recombination protein RmuC [Phycisphaerae bacterium]|nr:DNA recombination protein RmuC [Phycisphaerae bacterium]